MHCFDFREWCELLRNFNLLVITNSVLRSFKAAVIIRFSLTLVDSRSAGPEHSCASRSIWRRHITPKLYRTHFTPEISGTAEQISVEIENVNRMLGSRLINVRLCMFQTRWNINNHLSYLCLFFSSFLPSLWLSARNRKPDIVYCPNVFNNKLTLTSADHR